MNISQVTSVAAAFEASRSAGVQQAASAAANAVVQREVSRAAVEADVKDTEAVQETQQPAETSAASNRRLDITV